MYRLTVSSQFAAAHNLINYQGKCEALHGHNWKVEATVEGRELDAAGMLVDFGLIKKRLNEALAQLDHAYLNELPAFREGSPSSERMARFVHDHLAAGLDAPGVRVVSVSAWETETSQAVYLPD